MGMTALRRGLRVLLLALLGIELAWLAVGNATLATHAVPRLIRWAQSSVDMDYRAAWSFWPGDLHVRDYWVRGRTDQAFQFRFDAEQVHAQVSLLALCTRTFRATRVRASGLRVAFRKLIDNAERPADGAALALLPPIEGFDPVPAKLLGPGEPLSLALATHGFWHLDLEDVRVTHVRELWVQALHWEGDGDVDGRVVLAPRTHLAYGPSTLTLRQGQVRLGERTLLAETAGRFHAEIAPLDPEALVDFELLRFVSGRGQLHAKVQSLAALEPLLGQPAEGSGVLEADVAIARGVLVEPSALSVALAQAQVVAGPLRVAGEAQVRAEVKGGQGALEVTLPAPRISLVSTPDARLEGGRVRLAIAARRLDLVAPFGPLSPSLELHDLHTASLPAWNPFLPKALALKEGVVTLSGKLALEGGGHGALSVRGDRLSLAVKETPIAGAFRAEIPVQGLVLAPLRFDCSGTTLRVDAAAAPGLGKEAEGWWAEVTLPQAKLALQPELAGEGEVAIHARSGRPVLALLAQVGAVPGVVKELLLLPDLKVGGEGTLAQGTLHLSGLHADGGRGHFAAALRLRDAVDAALLVNVPVATVGVEIASGKPKLHLLDATAWFGQASSALEAPDSPPPPVRARRPPVR